MSRVIIFFIKLYQYTPMSLHSYCRCEPTCSQYMIEALETYGLQKGLKLGIKRIMKCRPGGIYGYQPLQKDGKK